MATWNLHGAVEQKVWGGVWVSGFGRTATPACYRRVLTPGWRACEGEGVSD